MTTPICAFCGLEVITAAVTPCCEAARRCQESPMGGNGETPIQMISKLRNCRFGRCLTAKRFVRDLSTRLDAGTLIALSPPQLYFLRRLRYMYRKQIGDDGAV